MTAYLNALGDLIKEALGGKGDDMTLKFLSYLVINVTIDFAVVSLGGVSHPSGQSPLMSP